MSLESLLAFTKQNREQPSMARGFLKSIVSPLSIGVTAGIATYLLGYESAVPAASFVAGGVYAALKEIIAHKPSIFEYKNAIALGTSVLHETAWQQISSDSATSLLPVSYALWYATLSCAHLMKKCLPEYRWIKTVHEHTPVLAASAGCVVFFGCEQQFSYGYEHFPLATFSLHASVAAASSLATASLAGLTLLLDQGTYKKVTAELTYWVQNVFKPAAAQKTLETQLSATPDEGVRSVYTQRKALHELARGKAGDAFLTLSKSLTLSREAYDPVGRVFTALSRFRHDFFTPFAALGIPFHRVASGITDTTLAAHTVIEGNKDVALRILYGAEEQNKEDCLALSLLIAFVHEHAKSPKTRAAYAYAASQVLSQKMLEPLGASVRAYGIDPQKNSFLSKRFVYFFGARADLEKQELIRQACETILDNSETVSQPIQLCIDLPGKTTGSIYCHVPGISLAESRDKYWYQQTARFLGKAHTRLQPRAPVRDYRNTLTNRIAQLPSCLAVSLLENTPVLWHYLGNDICYDRDSHGKQYIVSDTLTILDHKPRPANHRMLDLAKLCEHTLLFSHNRNDRFSLFEEYEKASGRRPELLSYLCAVPLVAMNSLYFHLVQKHEPGFCTAYLHNARNALSVIKKSFNREYMRFRNSFDSIDHSLVLAQSIVQ